MFRHHLTTYALLAGLIVASGAASGCSREPVSHADTPPADHAPADQELAGTTYGAGVSGAERVNIAQVLADPDAYAGKTVQVEGTVTDVCPKRGCWFDMAGQKPGEKMRFKVQDGVMVFPMDAKGGHAVAEGVVSTQVLTLEQTRKYLEYQASEYGQDVDPESVTEPMTIVRLDGVGAVIRDRQ